MKLRIAVLSAILTVGPNASAADEEAPKEEPPKNFAPVLGVSLGSVVTSNDLGPSFGIGLDAGFRKRFGAWALVAGLRPTYERFAVGFSDDRACGGAINAACANNTSVYRSGVSAHGLSGEVPLKVEYHTEHDWIPFFGIAPSVLWLRTTHTVRGIIPRTDEFDETTSRVQFALSMFVGLGVPVGKHGSFTMRFGYRFAPKFETTAGELSARGALGGIGYLHSF